MWFAMESAMGLSLSINGTLKLVNIYILFVTDNIRIVEIEYVLKYLLAFNYVISRSEELQEYNHE